MQMGVHRRLAWTPLHIHDPSTGHPSGRQPTGSRLRRRSGDGEAGAARENPLKEMVAPSRGALVRGRPCSRAVLLVRAALHAGPALLATSERGPRPRPLPPRFSEKGAGAAAAACPGRGEERTPQASGERRHHITLSMSEFPLAPASQENLQLVENDFPLCCVGN
ncbi:hypothetical protein IscW_ISCW008277 [Ixodes scapularis]|uniref:Uncharacterized protein n=1 Tax=Ixodes scapularis TaxID=6945 RepID=B7PS50_IXOSC|nr:hypothetical protein IscW_ISCW008277 [Ixodes scapularis]|eukprot:XP_002401945.1 hypothetical protein IscW_ISCW008277 [Ixodes scapularis]